MRVRFIKFCEMSDPPPAARSGQETALGPLSMPHLPPKVNGPERPGFGTFALIALGSLALGALLSAWALGLL